MQIGFRNSFPVLIAPERAHRPFQQRLALVRADGIRKFRRIPVIINVSFIQHIFMISSRRRV